MEITNLRYEGSAGGEVVRFDVQLSPDIELRDWQLKRTANGWRSYPPRTRLGRPPVWCAKDTHDEITLMARAKMEASAPYDQRTD